jgi:hypothetical protein
VRLAEPEAIPCQRRRVIDGRARRFFVKDVQRILDCPVDIHQPKNSIGSGPLLEAKEEKSGVVSGLPSRRLPACSEAASSFWLLLLRAKHRGCKTGSPRSNARVSFLRLDVTFSGVLACLGGSPGLNDFDSLGPPLFGGYE